MDRFIGKLATDAYGIVSDEARIAHIAFTAAQSAAVDKDGILDGVALPAAAADVTAFEGQPPSPRNITAVCSGTQTGNIVVTGTNLAGKVITETITLTSDTPVAGNLAFATITKIR